MGAPGLLYSPSCSLWSVGCRLPACGSAVRFFILTKTGLSRPHHACSYCRVTIKKRDQGHSFFLLVRLLRCRRPDPGPGTEAGLRQKPSTAIPSPGSLRLLWILSGGVVFPAIVLSKVPMCILCPYPYSPSYKIPRVSRE